MKIQAWISKTRARDLMVESVVSVRPDDTLATAANVLLRENVSGVPVVDGDGKCVGVFSVSDIPRAEVSTSRDQQAAVKSRYFTSDLALPASVYEEQLSELSGILRPAAEHAVEEFMTRDVVSVHEDTQLDKIVGSMVDARIHRLLVVDNQDRLIGIVTTIDVLAALMRATQAVAPPAA